MTCTICLTRIGEDPKWLDAYYGISSLEPLTTLKYRLVPQSRGCSCPSSTNSYSGSEHLRVPIESSLPCYTFVASSTIAMPSSTSLIASVSPFSIVNIYGTVSRMAGKVCSHGPKNKKSASSSPSDLPRLNTATRPPRFFTISA